MWTCRSARITPCFSSTTPFGPTSTQPGVPSILPLARTGRSMPSEMPSVKANSTWLAAAWDRAPAPSAASAAAARRPSPSPRPQNIRPGKGPSSPSACPGPNSVSTCSSVKWTCRAEMLTTSSGLPAGPPTWASTISRTICSTRVRSIGLAVLISGLSGVCTWHGRAPQST